MQGLAVHTTTDQPRYVITDADRARVKAIDAAWKAYHGQLERPLKPMPGEADDNVMVNPCVAIVKAGRRFLFGKELEIKIGETDPQDAQTALNKAWGKKEARMPLLQKLHDNGAVCRNAFLRIVPSTIKAGREQTFRLVALDPATVYLHTAPGDVDTVLLFCIQYSTTETVNMRPQQVYYREEIARIDPDGNASAGLPDDDDTWELRTWKQVGAALNMEPKAGNWQADGPPIAWPYTFPPIFFCQNMPLPNEAWGQEDITDDIISLNNALNLAKSCANRNNKLLAQPIIAASGMDEAAFSLTPGHINIHSTDGKVYAVAIHADIAASLALIKDLREDVDQQSSVPSVASGRMESIPRLTSGIAVELMYQTLIMANDEKRCTYGKLIIDVSKAILTLSGFSQDIDVHLPWQSPLPHDDLPGMQATVLKKQIGISNATLQREEGYDPEEELALSQAEDAAKLIAFARGQGMPPVAMPGQPPAQPPAAQPMQPPPQSPFMVRDGGQAA